MAAPHPAKFSDQIIHILQEAVDESIITPGGLVLDPFGGVGTIHRLRGVTTLALELEPEWAFQHPRTLLGNALRTGFPDGFIDAICTSPVFGNRLSDSHVPRDGSRRYSYTFALGRPLLPANAGRLQWGARYREFHEQAWGEMARILRPNGVLALDISDHIRSGERIPVADWHRECLRSLGLQPFLERAVSTPRLRYGANHQARVEGHLMIFFRKSDLGLTSGVASAKVKGSHPREGRKEAK